MLAIITISLSLLIGFLGYPLPCAFVCGLILATLAISERRTTLPLTSVKQPNVVALAIVGSLIVGQVTSIGSFAVGQLLVRLVA